ncbi:MAG: hypothetical protein HFE39_10540 [Clostridiales bacterium]|jgi:electron transport complex protein RnfA|nr:hypothetical protein [Clostridiales bacterium]
MMVFWELMGYALLAVFAENLVLVGGVGSSRMLRAARKPQELLPYAGMLCFFTLCTALFSRLLDPLIAGRDQQELYRPLLYACCAAGAYILVTLLLKGALPRWYARVEKLLPSAAINCIVIALPFLASKRELDIPHVVALSLGAGVGFIVAAWLAAEGVRRINNTRMAKAFLGLPALFLYLGILSLALMGFGGMEV